MHARLKFADQRSKCSCEGCQVGCRVMPGMLAPGDLEAIIDHVKPAEPWEWIASHFVASEGALAVFTRPDGTQTTGAIPTITPAQRSDGSCVFYDSGRCEIHEVSPFGCAFFSSHDVAGPDASHYAHATILNDRRWAGPYAMTWTALAMAGRLPEQSRDERRWRYEAETARVAARKAGAKKSAHVG